MSRRMSCPTSARAAPCPASRSRPDSPGTASVSGRPLAGWRRNLRSATRPRWTRRRSAIQGSATARRSCWAGKSNPAQHAAAATSFRLAELEHVVIGFADGDISSAVFLALRERRRQGPDAVDPVLRVAWIRIHFRRADEFEPRLLRQCNRVVLAHVPILGFRLLWFVAPAAMFLDAQNPPGPDRFERRRQRLVRLAPIHPVPQTPR